MLNDRTACQLVQTAADAISANPAGFNQIFDSMPAAIYVTDREGMLTYFNQACVELAGRTPEVGSDQWCVTWKLFTLDGQPLPHDRCPMADAIATSKCVRDVEAIAERPDGSRVNFIPYPTPLYDRDGKLAGAVNLLIDVSSQRTPQYLREQAARCRHLAGGVDDKHSMETLMLMAAKYEEQARKVSN